MQVLPALIAEMRALGIKSLALELADDSGLPPRVLTDERPTLAPDAPPAEPEQKAPNMCVAPGCTAERAGIFGGLAREFCRTHAMQKAGVRT